ncbi:MAG: EAL domain-containing protein [Pseudomonadota bacterium]|nr:EAL domain-containing protein [Pseudomonadota bacterium]
MISVSEPKPCAFCRDDAPLGFEFTVAFQPIVDITNRSVFAYESLVRGLDGSGASTILERVNKRNVYTFDQKCRVTAVEMASKLNVSCFLSINFLPNAVYQASTCIRATLAAAKRCNFPTDKLIFEITENEAPDEVHLKNIVVEYRRQGFKTAFDDFGAGYSGLSLLAQFQPDIIKLDMALVRGIDKDATRQAIARGLLDICRALRIEVIAEGVEEIGELKMLQNLGVHLFQGFLFARPGFESLPDIHWPDVD